ncbi:MAG TPA: hypothetical protein DCG04_16640, partial [Rhodospirillaceae bacterium]|nr:hypothetical protein [Rhodospirillaceae bacterium]
PILAFGNHAISTDPLETVSARKMDIVFAVSSFDPHGLANAPGVAGFLRAAHRFGARVVGL